MTPPNPMPRKYQMVLDSIVAELQIIGRKARATLQEVETHNAPPQQARHALREIEAMAYRMALELSDIQTTEGCDGCPAAPPSIQAKAHLFAIADELEHQAALARAQALSAAHPPVLEHIRVGVNRNGGGRKTTTA